ncbi:MAG: ExeA family protein [Syntrophales bacterium]
MIETTAETLAETKYYEYWGLNRAPFDNVPDPSMYVDCHASMESAVAETLFAIEEGDECIAVIVGDVGLGKTLTIRLVIDLLEQEKYKIALITNPGITFIQVLQEIIGQLQGKQCEEKRKVNLLETFNKLLFSTLEEGKKILIFIDECNAISPENLENLRLLTNMQGDGRNLFTMVLAGQIEFAKRLEHPSRANFFQRVGTYCKIARFESASVVKKYVETRLKLTGATRQIFAEDAFAKIWENADGGVPRLINKLCKLCLKAGETNGLSLIKAEVVEQIGSRFNKMTRPNVQRRLPAQIPGKPSAGAEPASPKASENIDKMRERYAQKAPEGVSALSHEAPSEGRVMDAGEPVGETAATAAFEQPESAAMEAESLQQVQPDDEADEEISLSLKEDAPADREEAKMSEPREETEGEISSVPLGTASAVFGAEGVGEVDKRTEETSSFQKREGEPAAEVIAEQVQPGGETTAVAREVLQADQEVAASGAQACEVQETVSSLHDDHSSSGQSEEAVAGLGSKMGSVLPFRQPQSTPIAGRAAQAEPDQGTGERPSPGVRESLAEGQAASTGSGTGNGRQEAVSPHSAEERIPGKEAAAKSECPDELEIHGCRIKIDFPEDLLIRSKASTVEYRYKMAGVLAAEALKKNSQLITSYTVDPVPIWQEIRDYVMTRFNQAGAM